MKLKKFLPYCTWKLHEKIFRDSGVLHEPHEPLEQQKKYKKENNSKIWEKGKIFVILRETATLCNNHVLARTKRNLTWLYSLT